MVNCLFCNSRPQPTISGWVEENRQLPIFYQPPESRQHFDVWHQRSLDLFIHLFPRHTIVRFREKLHHSHHSRCRLFSATRTRRARLCYAEPLSKEATMRGGGGGIVAGMIILIIIVFALRYLGIV